MDNSSAMDAWISSEATRFKRDREHQVAIRWQVFTKFHERRIARRSELADKIKWGEESPREAHEYAALSKLLDDAWSATLKEVDDRRNWIPRGSSQFSSTDTSSPVPADAIATDKVDDDESGAAGQASTMSDRLRALYLPRRPGQ